MRIGSMRGRRWGKFDAENCNGLIKQDTLIGSIYTASRGVYEATKSTKKPTYSLEFKQDAAKLVLEKGYSCQKAADHLGVSLSALS